MKKNKKNLKNFETLLKESLGFHGLLTPAGDPNAKHEDIDLPNHLKTPDFLFKTKEESFELPKMRIAAFKGSVRKKKK